jgi:hypothetical protein
MAFYDAFFGSDQSLYTAYAIISAIIAICITILLTATDVSVGNRILIVLFVIVTLIPSIFLTLFEITCIVTGGTEPNRWWCYAFAWILAAFIILYCIFVVVISLISLFTYNNAIDNVNETEKKNKISDIESNHIAKQIIHTEEEKKKIESFYNDMLNANEQFKTKEVLHQFQNKENFGAQPLNEVLQTPPAPVPPPSVVNKNEGFDNTPHQLHSKFTNNEKFQDFDGKTKSYFSDFNLNLSSTAGSLLSDLQSAAYNNLNPSFNSFL